MRLTQKDKKIFSHLVWGGIRRMEVQEEAIQFGILFATDKSFCDNQSQSNRRMFF